MLHDGRVVDKVFCRIRIPPSKLAPSRPNAQNRPKTTRSGERASENCVHDMTGRRLAPKWRPLQGRGQSFRPESHDGDEAGRRCEIPFCDMDRAKKQGLVLQSLYFLQCGYSIGGVNQPPDTSVTSTSSKYPTVADVTIWFVNYQEFLFRSRVLSSRPK